MTPSNHAPHEVVKATHLKDNFRRGYIALLLVAIVVLSIAQGLYTLDPHHWGLMLSNAKDLWDGRLPYQEIFIQYGLLTTLLQGFAFGLGGNLLSIISMTSLLYAIGVWIAYLISTNVLVNKNASLYVVTGLFLFHPLAIYPWANYIAFPFLLFGIYALVIPKTTGTKFFLGGLSFGFAVLSREGLAPAVALLILLSFIYDLFHEDSKVRKDSLVHYGLMLVGLTLSLGMFFTYLYQHNLISYWILLSFDLPKIYAQDSFQFIGSGHIFSAVFKAVDQGWRHGEVRWIFISIVWLLNLAVFMVSLVKIRDKTSNSTLAKLSLATLLLISSSLHLTEIFRIATASSIGLITLYAVLEKYKKLELWFFVMTSIWMALTLGQNRWTGTNYFLPSKKVISEARLVESPEIFRGNRWNPEASEYYEFVQNTLEQLKHFSCGVEYQHNKTKDSFFKILSPFPQLQIAPYENGESVNKLRPDLDFVTETQKATSIVILQMTPIVQFDSFQAPEGFAIFAHRAVPQEWQMPENQELLILVPRACLNGVGATRR